MFIAPKNEDKLLACENVLRNPDYENECTVGAETFFPAKFHFNCTRIALHQPPPRAAAAVTPLMFSSCQQVDCRELRVQMTGGRAEWLQWNENGTALDNMATNRFKSLCGSEDPSKRCCPDASFQLQLKCSFHESECRSLVVS